MSDKNDLLPCPFCGQQDAFVEQLDSDASVVICQGHIDEHSACLARGPVGVQESDTEGQPGKDAAIREWNRRAALSQQQAPTWGYAKTIGNLIAQLRTLDPSTEVYAPHRLPDGRVVLDGLTLSHEWRLGRFLQNGDGAQRVAALWTQPAVFPTVEQQDAVLVPRELLSRHLDEIGEYAWDTFDELRELLGKENA